jgi:hypothetical protein
MMDTLFDSALRQAQNRPDPINSRS